MSVTSNELVERLARWQIIFGVTAVRTGIAAWDFYSHFLAQPYRYTGFMGLVGLLDLPLTAPLLVALWFYAFKPARAWRRRTT
ncbi:MAG TPA: hypothetical protein VMB84_05065 [Stellaceae bacterium]|nr:hypothetical protein [Stellaceae bacterium]